MRAPAEITAAIKKSYDDEILRLINLSYRELYRTAQNLGSVRALLNIRRTPTRWELMNFFINRNASNMVQEMQRAEVEYFEAVRRERILRQEINAIIRQRNLTREQEITLATQAAFNNIRFNYRGPFRVSILNLEPLLPLINTPQDNEIYLREIYRLVAPNPNIITYSRHRSMDNLARLAGTYVNDFDRIRTGDKLKNSRYLPFLSILGDYNPYVEWEFIQLAEPEESIWRDIMVAASPEINCGIKTLHQQLPEALKAPFLADYGHILSDTKIPLKMLDKIGKSRKYGISIHLYTEISMALGKPKEIFGRNNGKVVKALLTSNHLTLVPREIITSAAYIEEITATTLKTTAGEFPLFKLVKSTPTTFMLSQDTENDILNQTLFKRLRPSSITGNPDDDTCRKYARCVDASSVLCGHWMKTYGFRRTQQHVLSYFRGAAIPFGSAKFLDGFAQCTEIDMNYSYSSFHKSQYFRGIPRGYFQVRKGLVFGDDRLALICVKSMEAKTPLATRLFAALSALRNDFSVLTAMEYFALRPHFDFEIGDCVYSDDWIGGELMCLADKIPEVERKLALNKSIGRLVSGGLEDSTTSVHIAGEFDYIELCRQECLDNGIYPDPLDFDNIVGTYRLHAKVPTACRAKYTHVYAFVLGYSKAEVITTLAELLSQNIPIISMKVDAIHIPKDASFNLPNCYPREVRYVCGEWKFSVRATPPIERVAPETPKFSTGGLAVDYGVPLRKLSVIDGPAGTGKTYNILSTAPRSSLLLQATLVMMNKCNTEEAAKAAANPNYIKVRCLCTAKLAFRVRKVRETKEAKSPEASRWGKKLREIIHGVSEVIIDEYAATDSSMLKDIRDYCVSHGIFLTLIGDSCQKINSISSAPATRERLEEWGFVFYEDPRNSRTGPNAAYHRHRLADGIFLDSIRGKPYREALKIALSGRFVSVDTCPQGSLLITNTHERIYQHHLPMTGPIRARAIADRAPCIVDKLSPTLWTTKRSYKETLPTVKELKGKKLSGLMTPIVPKFIAAEAMTVEGVQGETLTYPICVDVMNLWAEGALYTALSRTRDLTLITLLIRK